ncbi:TPA: CapA family protein [Neisseria meningitidis]
MRTLPSATSKARCLTKAVRRKNVQTPKICYAFRTPSAYGQYLADAGFDYLSFANNHSNDFGAQGITATAASGSSFTYSIALKPLPITRPKLRKIPPSPR